MSEKSITRRAAVLGWLLRRDTVFIEAFLGLAALLIAWRSVEFFNGVPSAPFTASLVLRLTGGGWMLLLGANGIGTLGALVWGLKTGNTFYIRAAFSLVASCVWGGLGVAALTSQMIAPSIAAGYCLPIPFAWSAALVLVAKAEQARHIKRDLIAQRNRTRQPQQHSQAQPKTHSHELLHF